MLSDLRYALRALRKTPGFTAVAVPTLALGIGANTLIFSVINGVLLRPLPFQAPERLVRVDEGDVKAGGAGAPATASVAAGNFRDWQARARSFARLAMYRERKVVLTGAGEPERVSVVRATAALLPVLGVAPALGRGFTEAEDRPGGATAAVISHRFWQERFGGDRAVLGRTVTLNGTSYEVVGVMPASFSFPVPTVVAWLPAALGEDEWQWRGAHNYAAVGRLRPGVTVRAADAEMRALAASIAADNPIQRGFTAGVTPLADAVVGGVRPALLVLAGAVGFVLLIACANVANLYLARAAGRRREVAIRSALGAETRRVVRWLLAESVLLATAGGAAGVLLASWGVHAVAALKPGNLPRAEDVTLDWRVLVFTAAVSGLTALLFGLAPALHSARPDLVGELRDGGRGTGPGRAAGRLRSALLVAQVAFSLLLLAGAGLMLKSFARLRAVDPGVAPAGVLTARVTLPPTRYDSAAKRVALYDALLGQLRTLPGVRNAALVSAVPLGGQSSVAGYWVVGGTPPAPGEVPTAVFRSATPEYFAALGIALTRGRLFTARDRAGAPPVAVITAAMARDEFAGADPIGRRVRVGDPEGEPVEIVGVVADHKYQSLDEAAPSQLYVPTAQAGDAFGAMDVVLRTAGEPQRLVGALRREVRALDPDLPVADVRTMDEVLAAGVAQRRTSSVLLGAFAALALLLAAVGVYGVIAYTAAQRTREFGVRLALGATRATVARQVVAGALRLVSVGVAAGIGVALVLTRVLASQLYEVSATDPAVLAGVAALLTGIALLASYLPARRATRLDPTVALRGE